jgi:methylated-DNA-[protein]-cysteine S-methyltransferase
LFRITDAPTFPGNTRASMTTWTSFDTAFGTCAVAWNADVITRLVLPVARSEDLGARVRRAAPDAQRGTPPTWVQQAITRMSAHLAGSLDDLGDIPVIQAATPFERSVYALTRAIPPGHTRTYGELAAATGDATQARAVGQAMARNPVPLIVPCHRVLAAGGALGGFSAPGGTDTKHRLLQLEGAAVAAQLGMFDTHVGALR